jgi:hypothetical protein
MNTPEIILSAETRFSREVALGTIYQLPLPIWYSLIPGMFIFDFLRRNTVINRYTKHFLFPRKLALEAAQSILNGEKKSSTKNRIHDKIENWLNSQSFLSQDLANAYVTAVDVLIDHYTKLLNDKGTSYNELIENAYRTRTAFRKHLDRLKATEVQIDQSIIKLRNTDEKLKERLRIEAQQIKDRRNKIIENIF